LARRYRSVPAGARVVAVSAELAARRSIAAKLCADVVLDPNRLSGFGAGQR
jgi:hypothetical protein